MTVPVVTPKLTKSGYRNLADLVNFEHRLLTPVVYSFLHIPLNEIDFTGLSGAEHLLFADPQELYA